MDKKWFFLGAAAFCLAAALLSLLIYGLNELGILTISIAAAALMAYLPFLIILIAVWYVVNRIL